VTENEHRGGGCPFCRVVSGGASVLSGLTPREIQISLAVARGKTNREIGEALHMSPKTVETHLSSVFRKLGIRSRTVLATIIAGESRSS
jgi:DNA-binding NarL/FixJ family response regulator